MLFPNFASAKQRSDSFEVSFTVLPTCSIKTDKNLDRDNNLKIISKCSHEDFYVTTTTLEKKYDKSIYVVSPLYTMSRVKNITNNEVHALVHDIKKSDEDSVITINF